MEQDQPSIQKQPETEEEREEEKKDAPETSNASRKVYNLKKAKQTEKGEIHLGKMTLDKDSGLHSQLMLMNHERLQNIADENPNVEVYEYAYEKVENVPPMKVIRPLLLKARKAFFHIKKRNPDWTDDQIRYKIIEKHPEINELFPLYGKNFECLTSSDCDENRAQVNWYMMFIREKVENEEMTEEEADFAISDFLQKKFLNSTPKQ